MRNPSAQSLIHERFRTVMSGLRDLFERRVNEKGRVSRRQSGASNRISGLESDTPFYEAALVLYGRGRRRSRLRGYHHCPVGFGEQRQWITKESEAVRGPCCCHEITIHSSRLKIYYAGRQRTRAAKRKSAAACCART